MNDDGDTSALEEALDACGEELAARRGGGDHWAGYLSSSALSTATGALALAMMDAASHRRRVLAALDWLCSHQDADGGWGDSPDSPSNISTTCLAWAALKGCRRILGGEAPANQAAAIVSGGECISRQAGSTRSDDLARTITAAYGADQTFSVPILTMLALAGVLGEGAAAWRHVADLPFELAALPHQLFRWLRLGVVSYALPALIAIGQVRHHFLKPACPLKRIARALTRRRTLAILQRIQPASGGYLEAAPLTSFVTMSLAAMGLGEHPVAIAGVRFLTATARADGSWPIDTNLATFVTTLAVNALASGTGGTPASAGGILPSSCRCCMEAAEEETEEDAGGTPTALAGKMPASRKRRDARERLIAWLLAQQYRVEHPYTHSPPGGWAWTNLSGGVPDADDTAGALLALHNLSGDAACPHGPAENVLTAARNGCRWLAGLQNTDGGVPTFCRGWGKLPFDRSSPDLTAHAIAAWSAWRDRLEGSARTKIDHAIDKALSYLAANQRPDGSWSPLWFGSQSSPSKENPTYGTARVVLGLTTLCRACYLAPQGRVARGMAGKYTVAPRRFAAHGPGSEGAIDPMLHLGADWLASAVNADGGWGGDIGVASSIEETALATEALASIAQLDGAGVGCAGSGPQGQVLHTERSRQEPDAHQAHSPRVQNLDANSASRTCTSYAATLAHAGCRWLIARTAGGKKFPPSPIGLYFARLWYWEQMYPLVFTLGALARTASLQERLAPS